MAENKVMDDIHGKILKKFHTLCGVLGLTADQKLAIVESYGVESSRDIDIHDLIDICGKLSAQAYPKQAETDKLRKRVIAAIGNWLKASHQEGNINIIKGIACRASGYGAFNKIPTERLRNLVFAFNNKVKDMASVDKFTKPHPNPIQREREATALFLGIKTKGTYLN